MKHVSKGKTMICYTKQLNFQARRYALSSKGKYWRRGEVIDIHFMGGTEQQRDQVIRAASEWLKYVNLKFNWNVSAEKSDVRISFVRGIGSWSYVGTDSLMIPDDQATMNFGWLDKETVLHEFGHMLGLLHEHQNPRGGIKWDKNVVYREASKPPNNWDKARIDFNIINKEKYNNTNGTEFDPRSIMLYFFPDHWTKNNKGTRKNTEISELDIKHISDLYPF